MRGVSAFIGCWLLIAAACGASATEDGPQTAATPAATGVPSSAATVTVGGVPLADPDAILVLGAQRLHRDDHDEARCYYSAFTDTSDIAPILRCGPARGANSSQVGPWRTLRLAVDPNQPRSVVIDGDLGSGWSLLRGERVFRPDGLQPPPEGNTSLTPPTAFDRTLHPIVRELPADFQICMMQHDLLVFDADFRYDGRERPEMFDELVTLEYVGHEALSFTEADREADAAAAELCVGEVAAAWDLSIGSG